MGGSAKDAPSIDLCCGCIGRDPSRPALEEGAGCHRVP
jgi:hypothetical protein